MTDERLRRAAAYRWLLFWILAVGYALVSFHRLCPAVLAVAALLASLCLKETIKRLSPRRAAS